MPCTSSNCSEETPGLDRIARRQTLADRKHHGIGQRCLIRSLSAALLLLITYPQTPFGAPLPVIFTSMHRQQCVRTITLGSVF